MLLITHVIRIYHGLTLANGRTNKTGRRSRHRVEERANALKEGLRVVGTHAYGSGRSGVMAVQRLVPGHQVGPRCEREPKIPGRNVAHNHARPLPHIMQLTMSR